MPNGCRQLTIKTAHEPTIFVQNMLHCANPGVSVKAGGTGGTVGYLRLLQIWLPPVPPAFTHTQNPVGMLPTVKIPLSYNKIHS